MKEKPYVGVWIDHREATLFWADKAGEVESQHLKSDYQETAEPLERAMPGAPGMAGPAVPHSRVEWRRKEQLKKYFKKLAAMLDDAEQIYLFGHGMAKKQFADYLREHKLRAGRVRGVESFDRMTRPQMVARVKKFFRLPREWA